METDVYRLNSHPLQDPSTFWEEAEGIKELELDRDRDRYGGKAGPGAGAGTRVGD